ncbi:cytochrome P450 [Yinghuangia seranimata]|uniref:cytochrome P450 n=1 Tax=Yinghuangia seranimata TaxID=408067 RepID=UPI00248C2C73|nr:cytochrome P450 [Yinghuangia seranimata]MDI2130379.1 cytochrome P450 [Yinghuangia seranimata]
MKPTERTAESSAAANTAAASTAPAAPTDPAPTAPSAATETTSTAPDAPTDAQTPPPLPPPPGPRLPAVVQTAAYLAAPTRVLDAARRRYGPVFRFNFVGFPPEVFLTTPESAAAAYALDAGGGRAGEVRRMALEPLVGRNSLLSLDGDPWARHRKLLTPPLRAKAIADYRDEIARIAAEDVERWPHGTPFALRDRMQDITLEVILRLVFGIRERERLDALRALLPALAETGGPAVMILASSKAMGWIERVGPLHRAVSRPFTRFLATRAAVDELLYDEIARRRADADPDATDVLSRLLRARDEHGEPMSDQELRDELITLLEAGHETTATALAWGVERLVRTPEVLAKLRAELDGTTGGGEERYLEAVVKETLRARPVVYDVPRLVDTPLRVGGVEIPAGWYAAPMIALIHRDPAVYPDPDAFRPERFLDGDTTAAHRSWMPFGGGRRYCVGAQLALLEMRVILREVLQRVDLTAVRAADEKPRMRHVTFVPSRAARVIARPRATRSA